jgi:hypothetical protein
LLASGDTGVVAARTQASQQPAAASQEAPKIPDAQLDSLVAPIALYPDPLLAQVLAASTYPLEIVQLQQWLVKNKNLKDKALVDAVSKEPWDPSIQGMVALPDVVKRLADDIQWTTDLGNAFLGQQSDVMDAVQRMRKKAQDAGSLKSNEQQKVETKVVENKTVVVVEQANPQVVYVPSYSPTVVYGPPVYPYPPIYYPPSTGAVIAASAISFGVGVAMGAAWGGGWGYGCGWGGNDVDINVNNNFNRNTNISNSGNRTNAGNRAGNTSNKFQHNPQHRGGAPYSNKATANKFGGTARGDSLSQRQSGARQQIGQQGGNLSSARGGGGAAGGAGVSDRAGGGGNRSSGAGGGGDRVGSREVSSRSGGGDRGALGSSGGYSGSSARSSSSRGSSSMGASRGGGGGGGGGRARGGGGGRRR